MTTSFARLELPKPLVTELSKRNIERPFPIQEASIPHGLAGRDISGKAPTGSGKTLAFGLPVISKGAKAEPRRPRALVLAPTRELAEQIRAELGPLAKMLKRRVGVVYGGVGYGPQIKALRSGVDILVATPGRLEDLIEQRHLNLELVDIVVIDEADRMADMGFLPVVRRILDQTSDDRQTLLFSATLDGDIAVLSRDYQHDPVLVEVEAQKTNQPEVSHHFWSVHHQERVEVAASAVNGVGSSIIFTRTRHGADRLSKQLGRHGVSAVAMHGGRSQNQRTRALKAFSTGKAQTLVATDVAARGIHVDDVDLVLHFDPPADHKDYLHRSGRTARAGAGGQVVSLVTAQQKRDVLKLQRSLQLESGLGSPDAADDS